MNGLVLKAIMQQLGFQIMPRCKHVRQASELNGGLEELYRKDEAELALQQKMRHNLVERFFVSLFG